MSEQFEADYKLTRDLEFLTDKLQQTYRELESEKQKTDRYAPAIITTIGITDPGLSRKNRPGPINKVLRTNAGEVRSRK